MPRKRNTKPGRSQAIHDPEPNPGEADRPGESHADAVARHARRRGNVRSSRAKVEAPDARAPVGAHVAAQPPARDAAEAGADARRAGRSRGAAGGGGDGGPAAAGDDDGHGVTTTAAVVAPEFGRAAVVVAAALADGGGAGAWVGEGACGVGEGEVGVLDEGDGRGAAGRGDEGRGGGAGADGAAGGGRRGG